MVKNKIGIWILIGSIMVACAGCGKIDDNVAQRNDTQQIEETQIPLTAENAGMDAIEFTKNLGAGWNLGNSLCCADNSSNGTHDVSYYERLWGNPVVTQKQIDAIKDAGFKTIRIPVTYRNHMDKNGKIDQAWLNRVKEIVDYVLADDMYCIINIHHEDWLIADKDKQEACNEKLTTLWSQIAEAFGSYGSSLIFEGFNEVINSKNQWDVADATSYDVVNSYNQTFVDTVRGSGKNNSTRYLILNTYAAKATDSVINGFVLPKDSAKNKLIVGGHIYDGIDSAKYKISTLYSKFVKNGIPVVIGEWGRVNNSNNTESVRMEYSKQILETAYYCGIPCLWWDDGGIFASSSKVTNFAIINRSTGKFYFDGLKETIIQYSNVEDSTDALKGVIISRDTDCFGMKLASNWQSGNYSYITGRYDPDATRICLKSYFYANAGDEFVAHINKSGFRILVRTINDKNQLVKSYVLANDQKFSVDKNEKYIAVSVYHINAAIKDFQSYQKEMSNGTQFYMTKVNKK